MREKELREAADCAVCGKPFGSSGLPMFWRVKIERHGLKADAIRRQDGLTAMLGGHALLASVMGPDEEMTVPLMEPVTVTICESCAVEYTMIAALALDNAEDPDA